MAMSTAPIFVGDEELCLGAKSRLRQSAERALEGQPRGILRIWHWTG